MWCREWQITRKIQSQTWPSRQSHSRTWSRLFLRLESSALPSTPAALPTPQPPSLFLLDHQSCLHLPSSLSPFLSSKSGESWAVGGREGLRYYCDSRCRSREDAANPQSRQGRGGVIIMIVESKPSSASSEGLDSLFSCLRRSGKDLQQHRLLLPKWRKQVPASRWSGQRNS